MNLLSVLLISCLGIIVYANTFHCSFHFDDFRFIVDNLAIRDIHALADLWKYWPCRFVTFLSFALNYHIHQLKLPGYHLFNLVVHLVSAILVRWLVILTLSSHVMKSDKISLHAKLIALLAGLVFVSHPIQTEAVTFIWQRAASLAALFYLASLCFYVKSRLLQGRGASSVLYFSSIIMAVAAMFTKENAVTLPLMILLYEFYFLRTDKNINWRYPAPLLCTLFIIPITGILTGYINFQGIHLALDGPTEISPMHYFLTQLRVMITYIRLVFLPLNQNFDYNYHVFKSFFEWPVLFSFLLLCGVLLLARRLFFNYRLLSFSIFWFFGALLPESSFVAVNDVICEHRLYLSLVGGSIFLVSGLFYLLGARNIKAIVMLLMVIITVNSVLTYQRNRIWKDEISFWKDAVAKSPDKPRTHNNLSVAYCLQGHFIQARSEAGKAIKIKPDYAQAYNNHGNSYFMQGDYDQAIADYTAALDINPSFNDALFNLSSAGVRQVSLGHNSPEKHFFRLGTVFFKRGDFAQAVSEYTEALKINPKFAQAYNNRGLAYYNQNKIAQAASDYNKAVEIDPGYADAYYNRGLLDDKRGNLARSLSDYNKAIEINPVYAQAYINRGHVYFEQNNFERAIGDYGKAIEINPASAEPYSNQAIIYYQLGKYDMAWAVMQKARISGIDIDPRLVSALIKNGMH